MIIYFLNYQKRKSIQTKVQTQKSKPLIRRSFLRTSGLKIITPLLEERGENSSVRLYLKEAIKNILSSEEEVPRGTTQTSRSRSSEKSQKSSTSEE